MNNIEFEVHKKFRPLLNILQRKKGYENIDTVLVYGGRESFKSYTVAGILSVAMVNFAWKILFCRYTMESAKDSVIAEVDEKMNVFKYNKKVRKIRDRFILNTDNIENLKDEDIDNLIVPQIVFKGIKTSSGNQTANLKSLNGFNCFVLDEAEEHPNFDDFKKVKRSMRRKDLPNLSILIFNPTSKTHWIYTEFFEKKGVKAGENIIVDNVCFIHMVYTDLIRFVAKENLRDYNECKLEYEKKLRGEKYNISLSDDYEFNILGGFREKAEGVIFTNWKYGEFDESLQFIYVMDFGVRDVDTLIKIAIDDRNKKIYCDELIYENGLSTEQLIERLNKIIIRKNSLIIGDSAAARTIIDIRNAGFNILGAKKDPHSIISGIKKIHNYEIILTKRSLNFARELNNYAWANKIAEIPIDEYNHCIDPLRYGVTAKGISW